MLFAPLLLSGLSLASAAAVASTNQNEERGLICIGDSDARKVANNFASLIANYSVADANAYLTSDFSDYSDSVSELINNGCPSGPATLGAPTFSSRASFEAGQGGQPSIPFQILNVWHGCDSVIMRWKSAPGPGFVQPEQQVTGIIVMNVTFNGLDLFTPQPWLINTVYSEFNSGAWLWDLNITTAHCDATTKKAKRSVLDLPFML